MTRFITNILLLCILVLLAYAYRDTISVQVPLAYEKVHSYIFPVVPCKEPIVYSLGSIDKNFNVSENEFLSALADAEKVWESKVGKELFVYTKDATNSVKVSLVYDYRQQTTNSLAKIDESVKDTKGAYDELKAKYTDLQKSYAITKSNLDSAVSAFNQKQKKYNATVAYWNAKGGAPQTEYNSLQAQKEEINQELAKLQDTEKRANEVVAQINSFALALNSMAKSLNLSVQSYNTVSSSLGGSFEEGVYSSDGANRKIDIFEFGSKKKLVSILAHELGHSLGIEHVSDPGAIMYAFNNNTTGQLAQADIDALSTVCNPK